MNLRPGFTYHLCVYVHAWTRAHHARQRSYARACAHARNALNHACGASIRLDLAHLGTSWGKKPGTEKDADVRIVVVIGRIFTTFEPSGQLVWAPRTSRTTPEPPGPPPGPPGPPPGPPGPPQVDRRGERATPGSGGSSGRV